MRFPPISSIYSIYLQYSNITTDTRQIKSGDLFFALKGDTFDGNKFALQALNEGASYVIIDNPSYYIESNCILVHDVLETLQQLALYHRKQLSIPVIAITGTNGKTTTKELLAAVLQRKYCVLATAGNLNNHIGVPLTILEINKDVEIAIIEMGANHQKEIAFLCEIALPTHGIITNIGKAHLEGFGGFEGVIKTKTELYEFLNKHHGFIFYNADNTILSTYPKSCNTISYSIKQSVKSIASNPFIALVVNLNGEEINISSQLIGEYNTENILAAYSIGAFFNIDSDLISVAIANYSPQNNRSQFVQTPKNKIIVDAYNANPTSMKAAIDNFKNLDLPSSVLILGDMLELGDDSVNEHIIIVNLLKQAGFNDVILVGPIFSSISHPFISFANTSLVIDYLKRNEIDKKAILLKGSRGIGLEKILDFL